ncbi:preprotein translocase subunit YajC [Nocardioides panacis]|uniref:Preprotein translocase subunit YajC n=1 Tax=Nocardioides panacis TaxID=2849501 RepID=A0A975T0L5_9ACTN|nr:preprotein translocase subunit YajC [Nocardioides panacis]QWZ09377.1 preprotein translocase subunit YajC [Nocardioides panacis]
MKDLAGFLPFVLIALVFWFLIVRPQRRRQQDLARTQSSIGPGTEVMLGSGFYGTVVSVGDDTLDLELAPGTTVKVARQAVVKVLEPGEGTHDLGGAHDELDERHPGDVDDDRDQPGDERHP